MSFSLFRICKCNSFSGYIVANRGVWRGEPYVFRHRPNISRAHTPYRESVDYGIAITISTCGQ